MKQIERFEYPEELQPVYQKAKRLEWITIAYLISTAVVIFLTMGNSQSMKTAWFEDMISLTPAIAFLISSRFTTKEPNRDFPLGFHRVVSIAYLCSALALCTVGAFLIYDSGMSLIRQEHPTIGTIVIFGHQIWLGYLMIGALLWGTFPAIIIGKKKLPLAKKLHDKTLHTDAKMNKADWMTAAAAIFGVIGIGLGWWWADSVAALLISVDIVHDGYTNIKQAVFDLMDQEPKTVEGQKRDPLIDKVESVLGMQKWVHKSSVRMREEGHVYIGQGFVIPATHENLVQNIEKATQEVKELDWRLHDFSIVPVHNLEEQSTE